LIVALNSRKGNHHSSFRCGSEFYLYGTWVDCLLYD